MFRKMIFAILTLAFVVNATNFDCTERFLANGERKKYQLLQKSLANGFNIETATRSILRPKYLVRFWQNQFVIKKDPSKIR